MPASLTCEQVEVLLEVSDPADWINPGGAWDFSKWDEPDATWVTDEGAGWLDATAYNRGFIIERGRQTFWDDINAGTVDLELDNTTGVFSIYGQNAYPRIRPNAGVRIYATWDGVRYPLFTGAVTDWVETHKPNDYTIKVRATDNFRRLSDPIDVEYHAGTDHQAVAPRINGLLDRADAGELVPPKRIIQVGHSTMTNYLTTRTLLDEIRVTAMSDCGIFFVDNDGTYIYLNRDRFFGRPTGKPIPWFGDGCNDMELPYAAVEPIIGDKEFGNVIVVRNVSQGTDSPGIAQAVDQQSVIEYGRFLWSPAQLVISNVEWLQGIADWQLMRRSTLYYRIDSFECYPIHDDDLWPVLLDMKIGILIKVLRRPPDSAPINANMLVDGVRIEATPDLWKFTVRCSPGTIVDDVPFWDINSVWDETLWL